MPNLGGPPLLRSLRARVRSVLIDVRWYLIVAINRRIDRFVWEWQEKNRNRT